MDMNWVLTLVLVMGLFDAALLMIGGLILAALMLAGRDVGKVWERIGGATVVLFGTNVAAALVLLATRYLVI